MVNGICTRRSTHCVELEISLGYVKKIRSAINKWEKFVSKSVSTFFEELAAPDRFYSSEITESYASPQGFRGESEPLIKRVLAKLESKFADLPDQWNFLYICFWSGLRPSE